MSLKKFYRDPFGYILKLPFLLMYIFIRGLVSKSKSHLYEGYVITESSGKRKFEHREIAEEILGRQLRHWEVVHHINGKRDDNRSSNLCVMTREDHVRYHAWYDWVYETYRRYPRRETQLRKLRETFRGEILSESGNKRNRVG